MPMIGKGQSTCLTAVTHLPNVNQMTISPTTSEYWLTYVGDTSSNYIASVQVIDTLNPRPRIQMISLYSGNCSQLTLVKQDSSNLMVNNIVQDQQYYLKLSFTSTPSSFKLLSSFAMPQRALNCTPTTCDNIVYNPDFLVMDNQANTALDPFVLDFVCAWSLYRVSPNVSSSMGYLDNGYTYMWGNRQPGATTQYGEGIEQEITLQAGTYDVVMAYKRICPDPPTCSTTINCDHLILDIADVNYTAIDNSLLDPSRNVIDVQNVSNFNWAMSHSTYTATSSGDYKLIVMPYQTTQGNAVTWVAVDNIHIVPRPIINYSVSNDNCSNTRDFSITISPLCNQTITSIVWSFGDGTTLTTNPSQTNVSHEYTAVGTYTSTVTINYSFYGQSLQITQSQLVTISYLPISISGPHSTCDTTSSYSLVNSIVGQNYQWNITPANAGTIISGNGTQNIIVVWDDNNINMYSPTYINAYNTSCLDTVHYKIWRCCFKEGNRVFNDETITSDLIGGPIYLNGTITINGNVNFSSANISMGQESKIIINPQSSLTVTSTVISEGCNYMWDGIFASSPLASVVTQNNSIIKDAFNAIVSENGAIINTSNTRYSLNLKGIIVKNYSGNNPLTVSNCKFYSTNDETGTVPSNLENPYSDRRGLCGIEIINMANTTVGNTDKATKNKFSYLDYGIDIANSNVNVYNNNFINLPMTTENTGIGVNVTNNSSAQYTVNIGGYNSGNIIYTNLFNNCKTGVNTLGQANLNFIADTLISIQSGYVINNNNSRTIRLSKNRLNLAGNGGAISLTSIAGSKIYIDTNYISSTFLNIPLGIGVENVMPQEVYGVSVRNNTIIGSFKRGIVFTNILKPATIIPGATERFIPYLYKNSIQLSNLAVALLNNYSGILVSGCTSTTIEENTITKTDGFTTTTETNALRANGINILTSTANYLCNNSVTNMGMGIRYGGNCKPSTNNQNILTTNYYGFRLDNAAIGNQGYSIPATNRYLSYDNQWITNYIAAGRVQGSLSETTNWYYRNSINYSLAPGYWTVQSNNFNAIQITPNQTYNCGYDGIIIIGGGGSSSNSMVNTNQTDASADIDYASYPEENLYYDATAVYRTNATLAGVNTGITFNEMDAVSENEIVNPVNIPLFAEVSKEAASGDLTISISGNSNITPSNLIEKNLQTVNDIYLNSWAKGRFKLSDTEYNTLLDIANQDYISGGYGVFGAEIMTRRYEQAVSVKNNLSLIHPIGSDDTNNESDIALYPNPANGNVLINSTQLLDNATVELFSINGTLVSICTVSANSGYTYQLNISMLKAGIYYCRVTTLEGKQMNSKLVVY